MRGEVKDFYWAFKRLMRKLEEQGARSQDLTRAYGLYRAYRRGK